MSGSATDRRRSGGRAVDRLRDAPINILIVDDEPKNLTVLETVLDDPGYRLVRAESADQALLALVAEEFALLILDIRMPGMTGFELAQMIKERKKTARVPIIFLTAYYNEDQHVLEGYGTGAVDYLHKPVNPAILRSKVAVFAELHRKSREIEVVEPRPARRSGRAPPGRGAAARAERNLDRRVAERTSALRAARGRAARSRPPQGRVPRDAGPRAAQPAGAGAQRRAAPAAARRTWRRRTRSARGRHRPAGRA